MGFIKVRSAKGATHEYMISEAAYNARPDAYVKISAPAGKKTAPAVKKTTQVARKGEKK